MKIRHFLITVAFALSAATAAASGLHETMDVSSAKGAWKAFEWQKTKEFLKEMETRPDFPVSTPLAYDYVFGLTALGERVQPVRKETLLKYLKQSQRKDGGFSGDKVTKTPSTLFTDMSLDILTLLKGTGNVNKAGIRRFVVSLKNRDGGFGFSTSSPESTLATTYYGIKVLASLQSMQSVDKNRTAAFVRGYLNRNSGGFGFAKGTGAASAKATYMALYTLNAIGRLDDATTRQCIRFLEATPCGSNAAGKDRPELNEVASAVQAAALLKTKGVLDTAKVNAFLKAIYIPVNGGFAPLEGYGGSPDATVTALRIFADLKRLN